MRESEAADVPLCGAGSCNAPFVNDVSSFHGPADDDGGNSISCGNMLSWGI